MTLNGIKTFVSDSFRLRPFVIGLAVGLAAPYLLRLLGWAL